MPRTRLFDDYLEHLVAGRRTDCRALVWNAIERGVTPRSLYRDLLWPAMEQIEQLYREDRINTAAEHMATRINRCLADQVQQQLTIAPAKNKRILICCAEPETQELGGQMCADLFESEGWEVCFVGGGVPNDEVLALVGQLRPDILLIHGMTPQGVPGVRGLIDLIRDVGVNPTMNILVTGGVFNRAADLWKEIHADLYAGDVEQALDVAETSTPRVPEVRVPGAPKKRRRRRPALMAAK